MPARCDATSSALAVTIAVTLISKAVLMIITTVVAVDGQRDTANQPASIEVRSLRPVCSCDASGQRKQRHDK